MPHDVELTPGLEGRATLLVASEHTAPHVGSGRIAVLATPVLINVFEAAALHCCEHLLPSDHQSLGTHLDIRHIAATPIGMRVEASARLLAVEGRTPTFQVEARDGKEWFGDRRHVQVVVSVTLRCPRAGQEVAKRLICIKRRPVRDPSGTTPAESNARRAILACPRPPSID